MGRAASSVVTLVLISLIVFIGLELMPGDACTAYLGRDGKGAVLESCRERMGLNRPASERFLEWGGKHPQRRSWHLHAARETDHRDRRLAPAQHACPLGCGCARWYPAGNPSWRDGGHCGATGRSISVVSSAAIVAMTIPEFISATLLILVFAVSLGWTAGVVTIGYKAPVLDLVAVIGSAGGHAHPDPRGPYPAHGAVIGHRRAGERLCADGAG